MDAKFDLDFANISFDFMNEDPVECLLCNEVFMVTPDIQPMLKHLVEVHKFIIGSPEEVSDFRHYILYWKKLQFLQLEDYCIVYITNTEDDAKAPSEKFYLLCDKLPEDKQFRTILYQMKLNFITHQKEAEYQDKTFSRQCIYCPATIGGGIANSFDHLKQDHGFSLGNPNNIVFGAKLLDILDNMLQRLQCLHCEKTFKNHLTLREHMRKKLHRSLNPKNKHYDKFYLLNYLKPGVPWEEAKKSILEEKEIYVLSELRGAGEIFEDEQTWMDWQEDTGGVPVVCLFCTFTSPKVMALLHHMSEHHLFHYESSTKDMNFYSKVKLINFIRTKVADCTCVNCLASFDSSEPLLEHIATCSFSSLLTEHLWDKPGYLIPFMENDGLLIDLEDNDIDDEDTSSIASSVNDEVVLPEDQIPVSSILTDWKLREELAQDLGRTSSASWGISSMSGAMFKCFFCSFTTSGFGGRTICINHMKSIHCFSYNEAFREMDFDIRTKIINYIRFQTHAGRCFVCDKTYITKGALDEHRILEGHTDLPTYHLYDEECCAKSSSTLLNDGFLQPEQHDGK